MIDSPRFAGGVLPEIGVVGAPPLPVLTSSVSGPSEVSPAPDCQIPAPSSVWLSDQRVFTCPVEAETPKIQPRQGRASQWEPKPA